MKFLHLQLFLRSSSHAVMSACTMSACIHVSNAVKSARSHGYIHSWLHTVMSAWSYECIRHGACSHGCMHSRANTVMCTRTCSHECIQSWVHEIVSAYRYACIRSLVNSEHCHMCTEIATALAVTGWVYSAVQEGMQSWVHTAMIACSHECVQSWARIRITSFTYI